MSERHDITLREATGTAPNPPGLIAELKELVLEIFPEVTESGVGWLRGKSQQEIAKAMEIRASAIEKLGGLENERLKLLQERDAMTHKASRERFESEAAARERMFALKTERLKAVVEALKAVKDLGIRINARTGKQIQDMLLTALSDDS